MAVKALACELPATRGVPLSRWSTRELRREVIQQGLVAEISGATIWRWLSEDALRPWRYRSWLFPRDPDFQTKAGRVLDLYAGVWQGQTLGSRDYLLSADEKTSIQARRRCHPSTPPPPAGPTGWNTNTNDRARWSTSPPGTCGAPDSLDGAKPATASPLSTASSPTS